MKPTRILATTLTVFLCIFFGLTPAFGSDVVVFGDSWGAYAADELAQTFVVKGYPEISVVNTAIPGTTASFWAGEYPDALPDTVTLNPDARWVWLSIGGNDLLAYSMEEEAELAAARIDRDIRAMLDALYAQHPAIKVVMFGYDFPNFEMSMECIALGLEVFHGLLTPQINQAFLTDIGEVQNRIAADYPLVTYVSLWGTLQKAGGVAGAPNPLLPSPSEFMGDCIHANDLGYTILMDALYEGYFADQIESPPACGAEKSGPFGAGLPTGALVLAALWILRRRKG